MTDLDALERAALAATEGPWHRNIRPVTRYPTVFAGRNTHILTMCVQRGLSDEQVEANCEFVIAASPSVVLALVRAARERDRFERALGDVIDCDHHNFAPESRATKIARAALTGEGK